MLWLVRDWSGSAAAGVVAGLLFAFAPAKIGLGFVTRPMITDASWTVMGSAWRSPARHSSRRTSIPC